MTVHNTPLLYVNTHLTYQEEGIPAQIQVLAAEVNKLIDPAVETVITGDFNIGRHREAIAQLRALGFEDAWTLAGSSSGPLITFPAWDLWDDDKVAAVIDENRIDWVCVRPPDGETTPPLMAETIHTHRIDPVPSDHFPVIVSAAR
jgi:endonuclease/exonuclease/phosphatase family metal-dependent hydrolase